MNLEHHPRVLIWLVILLAAAAILCGGRWMQEQARASAYRDASECWRILREMDSRFANVSVMVSSHPRANVYGDVVSQAVRDELDRHMTDVLGIERRKAIGFSVRISEAKSAPQTQPLRGD